MAEVLKVIADVIQEQMDLKNENVFLYNQALPMPIEKGIVVNIAVIGDKPFGASSHYEDDPVSGGLTEVQGVNLQEIYSVLVYSKDNSARLRRHELIMVMKGTAMQQMMEKYSFKIGYIPAAMTDVSEGDGASRLNRYSLTFRALLSYSRRRSVEYFNKFENPPKTLLTNP